MLPFRTSVPLVWLVLCTLKAIDVFSLYILFSQCRSCDVTLESCFFEFASCSRAYIRIIYEKTRQTLLGTSHDLHWENKIYKLKRSIHIHRMNWVRTNWYSMERGAWWSRLGLRLNQNRKERFQLKFWLWICPFGLSTWKIWRMEDISKDSRNV